MKAIINTKLVMEDGIIWDGALTYENDKIVQVGWAKDVTIPADAEVYDAQGLYTAPGLVDIHNHGGGDWLFAENPTYCSEYFLKHGETTILPTFYHNLDLKAMLEGAEKVRQASKSGVGKVMDGLYMEGPFMDLAGSFQNELKWSGAVKEEDYTALVEGLGDLVRIWAIDPDRENIESFMAYAKEKTPNVIFAHGHSVSTAEAIRNVLEPAGIPAIVGEEGLCRGCGVATLSIDYYDLGTATGEMAVEILANGADVSTMPVEYAPIFTKKYNAELAQIMNVAIPEDYVVIG